MLPDSLLGMTVPTRDCGLLASRLSLSHQLSSICSPNNRQHNGEPYSSGALVLAHTQEECCLQRHWKNSPIWNHIRVVVPYGPSGLTWLTSRRDLLESTPKYTSAAKSKTTVQKGTSKYHTLPIRSRNARDVYHPDHSYSGRFGGTVDKYLNSEISSFLVPRLNPPSAHGNGPHSTTAPSRHSYNTSIYPSMSVQRKEVLPLRESPVECAGIWSGDHIYFEIGGTISTVSILFPTGSMWKQMEVLE